MVVTFSECLLSAPEVQGGVFMMDLLSLADLEASFIGDLGESCRYCDIFKIYYSYS